MGRHTLKPDKMVNPHVRDDFSLWEWLSYHFKVALVARTGNGTLREALLGFLYSERA
jgi:hypothetical protein